MPVELILMMGSVLIFGLLIIIVGSRPQKEQKVLAEKLLKKLYAFLSTFFLTSGKMLKISDRLSALSLYNRKEIQMLSTKYFLMSASVSMALVIAGIVIFNDTISVLICITFALVINTVLVDKQLDVVNRKVYYALKYAISSIRQEYLRLGSVPEALSEADIPQLLHKPFDEIYQTLTSANGEVLLLRFYEANPFRAIQTLAGICYNINNSGDSKDTYGQSNFVQALTMLAGDVNSEIERLATLKAKFSIIEYLTLIPIIAMPIVEGYFSGTMPGTTLIYSGLIGYASRIVILISCAVCYSVVATINSSNSIKDDDRSPWSQALLKKRWFRQLVYDIQPKNAKCKKLERKLKNALSKKTVSHVYAEKVVLAAIGLAFSFVAVYSVVSMSADYYLTSTDQLSLTADDSMDGYTKEDILAMDNAYIFRDYQWTDEELMTHIKGYMPSLSDLQIQDQMARIKNKESSLETAYFHWYYTIICYLVCLICWFVPNLQLMFRTEMVKTEAEEDFLQLQTLMAILMNMELDTLDAIWQLCQHSRIHKDMLLYCYHSYPANPELELARLKSKTPIIDFRRFLGKLELTISDLSLAEAYSDLKIERDHMMRVRETAMYATINKKRRLCSPISMAPVFLMVGFDLLLPLGYLGIKEFTKALGSMNA